VTFPVSSELIIGGIDNVFPRESTKTGYLSLFSKSDAYAIPVSFFSKISFPENNSLSPNGINDISFGCFERKVIGKFILSNG
jgi:hypothetical protein